MKRTDIEVGAEYAQDSGGINVSYPNIKKVRVLSKNDTDTYRTFTGWRYSTAEHKGVKVGWLNGDGEVIRTAVVASREIIRPWAEQEVIEAEAKAANERRAAIKAEIRAERNVTAVRIRETLEPGTFTEIDFDRFVRTGELREHHAHALAEIAHRAGRSERE